MHSAELAAPNGAGFGEAIRGAALATAAAVTDVTPVSLRIPVATYRLQFNARFTFSDARAIVDYLEALGISDCYASSYLKAVPGSRHGYDVADPTTLNPEIGTDEDYWSWIEALRRARHGPHPRPRAEPHGHRAIGEPVVAWTCSRTARARVRALLRHRVASGQGRAGRQGADPDPRRPVRCGARAAGAAARLRSRRRVRRRATTTTGCRSRRIRIRASSRRGLDAWLAEQPSAGRRTSCGAS